MPLAKTFLRHAVAGHYIFADLQDGFTFILGTLHDSVTFTFQSRRIWSVDCSAKRRKL